MPYPRLPECLSPMLILTRVSSDIGLVRSESIIDDRAAGHPPHFTGLAVVAIACDNIEFSNTVRLVNDHIGMQR